MQQIYSLELEKYVLAGILRFPETFMDIDGYVTENDFCNNLHKTIFGVIRQTLRGKEKIEKALIAQKINTLSLSFEDKVSDIFGYLTDLSLMQINYNAVKEIAEELKLVTIRRELANTGIRLAESMGEIGGSDLNPNKIIAIADEIYNGKISIWDEKSMYPENIFSDLPFLLEERANNPIEEVGYSGPHPLLNRLYGSLLRPGNFSVVCARAGAGKTTFLNDLCYKTSEIHDIPILHFDNGEMLKEELQMRSAASLSGVPLHYLETGKYAQDHEMLSAVKKIYPQIKNRQFYYYNVAGKSTEDMLTLMRRFYLSKIGRGGKMIFCFDYIKSSSEKNSNKAEWETIGILVTKFKDFISKEVIVPMISAVQANRSGVVTNRDSSEMIDDESIFSGSDRVVFYASHAFILRKKTHDELKGENGKWGTHKLISVKDRHLGQDIKRALGLVKLSDGRLKHNYLNLDINNFSVTEKGDLYSMSKVLENLDITDAKPSVSI